jgi:NAD(P)H-dependent FMN reductase
MILVIAATNREGSNTLKIAKHYASILQEKGKEVELLSLEALETTKRNESVVAIEDKFLKPATKYIIISPEYNGSFSGIFKLLVDMTDVKNVWHTKKAALVGVATGRAGNLRGMDHLTNIMNHLKVTVLPNKLPLSSVQFLLDEIGGLKDEATKELIDTQIEEFIKF